MHMFWKSKPPKRKAPRRKTIEERTKRLELKEREVISDKFLDMVEQDPQLSRSLVAQKMGLKLPEPVDESIKASQDLKAFRRRLAMERLESDPELRKKFAERELETLEPMDDGREPDGYYPPYGPEGELESYMRVQQFLEAQGGGKKIIDASVITALLNNIPAIMVGLSQLIKPQGQTSTALPPSTEKTYVIITPNGPMETNLVGYQKWLEQQKQLTAGKPPEQPESVPQIKEAEAIVKSSQPSPERILDIRMWEPYIGKDVDVFITFLSEGIEAEEEQALLAHQLLVEAKSARDVVELLNTVDDPSFDHIKELLADNEQWLDKVIAKLKGK